MHEGDARRAAGTAIDSRRRPRALATGPGRVALSLGVLLAAVALPAAAAAQGAGGIGGGGGVTTPGTCLKTTFGERNLQLGDCGSDVKVLTSVLKASPFGDDLDVSSHFDDAADAAVRQLQGRKKLTVNGVVDTPTRKALKRTMDTDVASWYGPGFYGSRTACGQKLKKRTIGVAHKHLPCGSHVTFFAHGRWLRTKVIDRGPYAKGRTWDLTWAAAKSLNVLETEKVHAAPIPKGKRGGGHGGGGGTGGSSGSGVSP